MTTELILTGERTLPGIEHENYWFRRHEAAYLALIPFTIGARVVEAGSGEGYGAGLLADKAHSVTALELDPMASLHSARHYVGVSTVRGNLAAMPYATGSVGVVACLQTIEHLWDQPQFVAECARVLRPAGTLLMTTPNTLTFPKGNPFHTRELTMDELVELLAPHFTVSRRWGLRHGWRLRRGDIIGEQIATPQDQWSPALRRRVAGVSVKDFVIGPYRPTDLDLVVVAVKKG
ncbi:MAG TPA: class I SAM-dependent methyltransferase [Mycobacteriales bacterium]|nr:class I SAM-dependent methyltransferase [Mycobacteriales bacterium]